MSPRSESLLLPRMLYSLVLALVVVVAGVVGPAEASMSAAGGTAAGWSIEGPVRVALVAATSGPLASASSTAYAYDDVDFFARVVGSEVCSGSASSFVATSAAGAGGDGSVTLYRAVSQAESDDIAAINGFRPGPNSYEGKLFAATAEDAASYGRINDTSRPGGEPFHIVETRVPASLARPLDTPLDGMTAVHIAEDQLPRLGPPTIWDSVPWVPKPR